MTGERPPAAESKHGQWWNAPPECMFQAYYMTLRRCYHMPALEAFKTAKRNANTLGIGQPGGFIGRIREAMYG